MAWFSKIIDAWFGPRDWLVVDMGGAAWAIHRSRLIAADVVLHRDLREGQAARLARRLRLKAEDMPRPLF